MILFLFFGLYGLFPPPCLSNFEAHSLHLAVFYWDSLSDPSHRPGCHSKWNNWKRTMKLYLHRNRVTCQRLQCRTPISFVFNQNEKFCWCRLFFGFFLACIHLISVCLCACLHASLPPFGLLPILCPCQCIKMISFQIGWQFTTWQTMQMAQWWYIYLLEAQLFLDCPTVLLHL